jgi:hypothetical protein
MGLSKNKPIIQEEPQMVKEQRKDNTKNPISKADNKKSEEARKISASTHYETCSEQLSPFGDALALIKFFDLLKFERTFEDTYYKPKRKPKLGDYRMVVGILMLLLIGFNRLAHNELK